MNLNSNDTSPCGVISVTTKTQGLTKSVTLSAHSFWCTTRVLGIIPFHSLFHVPSTYHKESMIQNTCFARLLPMSWVYTPTYNGNMSTCHVRLNIYTPFPTLPLLLKKILFHDSWRGPHITGFWTIHSKHTSSQTLIALRYAGRGVT